MIDYNNTENVDEEQQTILNFDHKSNVGDKQTPLFIKKDEVIDLEKKFDRSDNKDFMCQIDNNYIQSTDSEVINNGTKRNKNSKDYKKKNIIQEPQMKM